ALLLLDLTCSLLARQLARIAADFENEGGFSERMHKRRAAFSSSSYFLSLGKIPFSLVFFVFLKILQKIICNAKKAMLYCFP
ncbi:MAG: four helix bundle suffix domain-containing protein, partial [Lentisphaeria bacterium]|nr:four helix bundle suffix domain-containing protein [Lentisphaeria bacterium]